MTVESWARAASTTVNSVNAPASTLANFLPGLTDIAYQNTPHASHLQPVAKVRKDWVCFAPVSMSHRAKACAWRMWETDKPIRRQTSRMVGADFLEAPVR